MGDKLQNIDEANKIIMKAREDWFKEDLTDPVSDTGKEEG
jgi:hypothetical protein